LSINLFLKWDFSATSTAQYTLEKQSYLIATIIKYIFFLKLPLFLFFIYSIDGLSNIIIGAMCSAGVIDASSYGIPLLILKLVNLYLFGFWLIIHYGDLKTQNLKFTKVKFAFFIVASIAIILEILLDFLMFDSIDVSKIALCCGALFSNASTSYLGILFTIDVWNYVYLFYISFALNLLFFFKRDDYLFSLSNIFFLIVAIISLIIFLVHISMNYQRIIVRFVFYKKSIFIWGIFSISLYF
jgi:hypothetical protein